jgi:pyrrolidone-carboxylate peptidase
MRRSAWLVGLVVGALGCGSGPASSEEQEVVVDTEDDLAWAQYQANLEFAQAYEAGCRIEEGSDRPRVLVTGFGRFQSNKINATGLMVSELLDGLEYPMTNPPAAGEIDPPGPQLAVAMETLTLDGVGEVDVCAMVLPVFWDLASVLALKEVAAFEPDFVMMNGVAGAEQPLWLELGAVNRAVRLSDGSDILMPIEDGAPLVAEAPPDEMARASLASWSALDAAAELAIDEHAEDRAGEIRFGDVLSGALFAGYPRDSNTYLCNNTTYVVGYVLDHPGESVRLLEASHVRDGSEGGLDVELETDLADVPRLFVHWPSSLAEGLEASGAEVMRTLIAAQVAASLGGDEPTRGDNSIAELVPAGETH